MTGPSTSNTSHRAPRIGILLGDRSNPFWASMQTEYERIAPRYNLRVHHVYADPERDPQAQLQALQSLVSEDYDALIVNPLTQTNLAPGIMVAAARGIPVVDVGGKTAAAAVEPAGTLFVPVQTVDFWEQGRIAGRYLAERFRETGGGRVALIEGRPESRQSIGRIGGALEILREQRHVEIVARVAAHFDRDLAREQADELLTAHPDLTAVFCANDLMALGVADAVDGCVCPASMDLPAACLPRPLIVGVDGIEEALQAVRAGRLTATVAFSPADVAQVILGAVAAALRGEAPPRGFTVESTLITRSKLLLQSLSQAVVNMDVEAAAAAAQETLAAGVDAYTAVEQGLMKGMEEVGRLYETYEYFVPELLLAGDAMNTALDVLKPHLRIARNSRGRVVLGVVQGDIHDIGKNVVRAMLEASGFEVVDLGKDVPPEEFLAAAERHGAKIIALSALMTTTMARMKDVIERLEEAGQRRGIRVIVGGAPLSAEFAASIGADAYSPTAVTAVEDIARLASTADEQDSS